MSEWAILQDPEIALSLAVAGMACLHSRKGPLGKALASTFLALASFEGFLILVNGVVQCVMPKLQYSLRDREGEQLS